MNVTKICAVAMVCSATAFAVHAMGSKQEPPRGITCEVLATSSDGVTLYEGRVMAQADVSGRYTLQVKRSGGGVSMSSTSSGDFAAKAGKVAVVARSKQPGDPDGAAISMTIAVDGGSLDCPVVTGTAT